MAPSNTGRIGWGFALLAGGEPSGPREATRDEATPGSELVGTPRSGSDSKNDLFAQVSALVDQGRITATLQVNAALTLTHWRIGKLIHTAILRENRADYGRRIVVSLAQQLTDRYGRGFEASHLRRMVKFAQTFPDEEIVVSLIPQLTWTHILAVLPLESAEARDFYIRLTTEQQLSVRELRRAIGRRAFERHEIADSRLAPDAAVPAGTFKDPYLLDFLGLRGTYHESDLETAILREIEAFLLEVGKGFAFVARQKRMTVGNDDFYLDLLFYSRPLHRLVAVELKIGEFEPAYEGQMRLYLKWLDRYARMAGEEPPIGLILCTRTSREQVELMELDKDNIVVAEYWTELLPRQELEERLQLILRQARERMARRALTAVAETEEK